MKTPRPTSNGGSYHVHCSGVIFETFKQIQKQAKDEGRGEKVLSAMRRIWHHLSYDPNEFGEALYRLPAFADECPSCCGWSSPDLFCGS